MAAMGRRAEGRRTRMDGGPADGRGHLHRRPEVPAAGGRQSILAQGYAPTKHDGEDDREGRRHEHHRVPPRAAARPEPPARRPRALVQGNVRADRVRSRSRRRGRRGQGGEARSSRTPARTSSDAADRPSSRTSTTSPARSASSARSASRSTARTRPPGASTPARAAATCRARPSSSPRQPSTTRRARD